MNDTGVQHTTTDNDVTAMTREELLAYQQELLRDRDSITAQLDHARSHRAATGEYADPHWFRRAESALRHKRRLLQLVSITLGSHKRSRSTRIENAFMNVARRRLQDDVFHDILREAQEALDAETTR